MNYTDLINIFNSINEYGSKIWTSEKIAGHRKLPDNYWGVKVLWGTVEDMWELM